MTLLSKYKVLIATAQRSNIVDLQITEQEGMLYIRGTAPSADVKNKLWDIYNQIDPNFLSCDVLMDVYVTSGVCGNQVRVSRQTSVLNIRKGPCTDQPIIGTATQDEIITLISRANDQWWLVRTKDGEEGYCYARYLEPVG